MSDQLTYFLKRIDTAMCGKGCHMRLGDIDGDGRMEIVMVQPDGGFDLRYFPHSVVCATAFTLEGELLWQIGTPSSERIISEADVPAQIYDIDNDGNNEFLCVMNDELCVFDGKTGAQKRTHQLPDKHAHDCIIIADLEGRGYAQNIILKNRYHQLWAMDVNFNVMWTYKGNIGHIPVPYDLDGDGREELIAGNAVLNGDGEVLWTIPSASHIESIWVGDLDCSGTPTVVVCGSELFAYRADGTLLWQYAAPEGIISFTAGNFLPEHRGTQIAALCRTESSAIGTTGLVLLDYHGNPLPGDIHTLIGDGLIFSALHGFDNLSRDLLLTYCRGGVPATIYDGHMNAVYSLPFDAQVAQGDLLGDGTAQILVYNDEKIEIYSAVECDLLRAAVPYTRPQPKQFYNMTRFLCGEMNPEQYSLGYITGNFATNDLAAWAVRCAAGDTADAYTTISRADFTLLLVRALGLRAYDREGFADVYPRDYFAGAVNTAKKLGIIEGNLGRFNPYAPMTAEAAVDMINLAGRECVCTGEGELSKRSAAQIVLELLS